MAMTRRDALRAGVGAAVSLGTPNLLAQSVQPILKTIPSSGEMIPPVGIGTNRYGVGESEDERAPLRATMARFAELGGRVIDTAAAYGTSEAVIGDIAAELGLTNDLFLATKTDIRGRIRGEEGLRNSFDRLRAEQIDLMMVHQLVNADTELPILREWQAAGRLRYIGASISSLDQYDEMEQFMLNEDVDFVQFNYSLGNRAAAERLLPTAADRGIAVMINLPFGGARRSLFNVVEGQELPEWAAEFDCASWAQFFLKYLISHPAVTCPIPGTRQVRHVNDNFGAARGRLPDAEQRRRQEQLFDSLA
ncbi:aldo/keto reductase [Candidatus Rariloculus sp.]|uniref:aldo/keto reductase n=1 Tax=Candidatus Rariloculus sp. TaxID=3101265 RepID=UPI003D1101E2